MIKNRKELNETLSIERQYYLSKNRLVRIIRYFFKNEYMVIWKYQKLLRKSEFFYNTNKKIRFMLTNYKKNKYGFKYGFSININCFDKGLRIWHIGNVVINPDAKIGKFCQLHGNCCIGNKGIGRNETPIIGDYCDIGYGAILIGNIKIGNNIKIGAGSVVTKSFEENKAIIVGNPAKHI